MSWAGASAATVAFTGRAGLAYGLLGLPLSFAALLLYVVLPHYYASDLGLSLATVGALLLLVRLLDAGTDPLLGRWIERLYQRGMPAVLWLAEAAAVVLGLGMVGLFQPWVQTKGALASWLVVGLLWACLAHSLLLMTHQTWGVRLGGGAVQRSRIVAWREGAGLVGVILASALSLAWGVGMLLAVFVLALGLALGAGQVATFALICALTGVALGADLVAPGALLALLIAGQGGQGVSDGRFVGWWNLATKLNLALAAGLALPFLQWLGYVPGSDDGQALQRLSWVYALLPCALKLLAAGLLYRLLLAPKNPKQGLAL